MSREEMRTNVNISKKSCLEAENKIFAGERYERTIEEKTYFAFDNASPNSLLGIFIEEIPF